MSMPTAFIAHTAHTAIQREMTLFPPNAFDAKYIGGNIAEKMNECNPPSSPREAEITTVWPSIARRADVSYVERY